tara:strand:- start:170 stop:412 length:243 start_codon:yes stop_codon:yes gene_type:complete
VASTDIAVTDEISCSLLQMDAEDLSYVPISGYAGMTMSLVLERLLDVGIADPDPSIRQTAFESMDSRFVPHLAQAENIRR